MKIIRLSTFLDFGGIESKMVNLSTYKDVENDWVFVAINKGGVAAKKIAENGKRVVCLNLGYRIPDLITVFKLFLFLRKEKPDVLHTSGAEANFFGFLAGKMAGTKNIVTEEIGIPHHSQKAKKIFQYIFNRANWVVGESKIVINNLVQNYDVTPSKTKVIHNFGVFHPLKSYENESGNLGTFKLVMISRLEPVKNIEGVLNVIHRFKSEGMDVQLSIAGTGSIENELRKEVEKLDLIGKVHFLGFINDPYPHLANTDLYILNSHSEGFSNSLIEAMYSKVPSLSTSVGVAPEIMKDSVNGFLIPPADEEALFEKIKSIISMPEEERQKIGIKGHQTIVKNFSLEKHILSLIAIYRI